MIVRRIVLTVTNFSTKERARSTLSLSKALLLSAITDNRPAHSRIREAQRTTSVAVSMVTRSTASPFGNIACRALNCVHKRSVLHINEQIFNALAFLSFSTQDPLFETLIHIFSFEEV